MDSVHAIGFYVSAALAGVGGLGLAFARHHERRGLALGLVGLGVAGAYASLSAGFAAVIARPRLPGRAALPARADFPAVGQAVGTLLRSPGAPVGASTGAGKRQRPPAVGALRGRSAGAGRAFAGGARFSGGAWGPPLIGQEMAVLLAIVALTAVALGVGLAGRESSR